jgi:hypothetical protein
MDIGMSTHLPSLANSHPWYLHTSASLFESMNPSDNGALLCGQESSKHDHPFFVFQTTISKPRIFIAFGASVSRKDTGEAGYQFFCQLNLSLEVAVTVETSTSVAVALFVLNEEEELTTKRRFRLCWL